MNLASDYARKGGQMRYLIDGHNLIGCLPDLSLDDPEDEAKLVFKLRSFCARTGKRVTVIFDGGLPGGFAPNLSNSKVQVIFALSERSNADQVLQRKMRAIKNVEAYTVVSGDQAILDGGRRHGLKVMTSAAFAKLLSQGAGDNKDISDDKDIHVRLSPQEVQTWLQLFTKPKKS
jgi:predicted RNA-binding protein with PIN domain